MGYPPFDGVPLFSSFEALICRECEDPFSSKSVQSHARAGSFDTRTKCFFFFALFFLCTLTWSFFFFPYLVLSPR